MNFADAMTTEMSHTKTWNGADALSTTGSRCLDFFGRIGAMRSGDKFEKLDLFDAAYAENPDAAMKLLKWYYSMIGFMPMLIKKRALNKLSLNKFYSQRLTKNL